MTDSRIKLQLIKGDETIEAERREALNEMLALADLPYSEKEINALSREEQLEILDKSSYRQKYQLLRNNSLSITAASGLKLSAFWKYSEAEIK